MVMSKDLISRKSVLDYIENEILKVKGTEALCVLRALSVHIEEYEPTVYDVRQVIKQLERKSRIHNVVGESKNDITNIYASACYDEAIEIVKEGWIDE
jgi:hypothetical protein